MSKLEQFQSVLAKEMSRKEFLQHVGVFVVGAVGITAFVNQFLKMSPTTGNANSQQMNGYGVRPYGR